MSSQQTWEDGNKMFDFIKNKMEFDKWYPIKTDLAFDVIKELFAEGIIPECELNDQETYIRKVKLDFNKQKENSRGWYDKEQHNG